MPKKYIIVGGFVAAVGWMILRAFGPWLNGLNAWADISLLAVLFSFLPLIAAFSAFLLGKRYGKKNIGLAGFYASAVLFAAWPGFIATLVVLYSQTRGPFLLTSVWTGIAAAIASIPVAHYKLSGGGDLEFAAGYALILAATAVLACVLLLFSLVSLVIHLVKVKRPNKIR
jgi:hypothetical protein